MDSRKMVFVFGSLPCAHCTVLSDMCIVIAPLIILESRYPSLLVKEKDSGLVSQYRDGHTILSHVLLDLNHVVRVPKELDLARSLVKSMGMSLGSLDIFDICFTSSKWPLSLSPPLPQIKLSANRQGGGDVWPSADRPRSEDGPRPAVGDGRGGIRGDGSLAGWPSRWGKELCVAVCAR